MNLPQDQLKAFFEVARLKSFTKAADFLCLTQSALSHRIKNLENFLSTSLFIRDSKGIRLTEAGDKLLKYTRVQSQIESEFINEFKTSSSDLSGILRIGGASTIMGSIVIPALSKFIRANPKVQIEMLVKEVDELPELLQSSRVDIVISCGKMNRYQFKEIYLGDEINVLVESNKFDTIPRIYLDHHSDDRTTIDYLRLHNHDASNLKRSYYDDIHGILAALEEGLGQAVIPLHILNKHKSLRPVRGERKLKVPIYLGFLQQPFYSKLHSEVFQILENDVPKLLKS